jgi:hypothetical protein
MGRYAADLEAKRKAAQAAQDAAIMKNAEALAESGDVDGAAEVVAIASTMEVSKKPVKSEHTSVSYRAHLEAIEVTDFAKVPDTFKCLDEKKIRAYWKADNKIEIDGLKLVTGQRVTVR